MSKLKNVGFNLSDEKKTRDASTYKVNSEKKQLATTPDVKVIDKNTYKRLKNKAKVITAEDRRLAAEKLIAEREKLENESAERKKRLQNYDNLRTKGKKLAEVFILNFLCSYMLDFIYKKHLKCIEIDNFFLKTS